MLAFVIIAAVAVVTPGADTLLVVRTVLRSGASAGVWAGVGIGAGCTVHATLSAAGVSMLVAQSPAAFQGVQLAGAGYLLLLGYRSIAAARRPAAPDDPVAGAGTTATAARAFQQGLVVNLLNPKVSFFYLALVPQFSDEGVGLARTYITLAGIHIVFGLVWFAVVAHGLARLQGWLTSSRARRVLDAFTGGLMVALALYVIWSARSLLR